MFLGSLPSLTAGTTRCLSCAMTSQVSVMTSRLSCHVIGSLTRVAPLLRITTLLFYTPPSSMCSWTNLHMVYIFLLIIFSQLKRNLLFNSNPLPHYNICMYSSVVLFLLQPNSEIISLDLTQNIPLFFFSSQNHMLLYNKALPSIILHYNTQPLPRAAKYYLIVLIICSYAECIYWPTTIRAYCIGTSCAELCEKEHCCMK